MKTHLFQSCGHCWVFQICWHIECSTLTTSTFRIWNSSAGIPSPPLTLFVVMLPKAHLTSHSLMSGCRWVITPSWLSESWRSFLYHSSVYSCHLFLISSASLRVGMHKHDLQNHHFRYLLYRLVFIDMEAFVVNITRVWHLETKWYPIFKTGHKLWHLVTEVRRSKENRTEMLAQQK